MVTVFTRFSFKLHYILSSLIVVIYLSQLLIVNAPEIRKMQQRKPLSSDRPENSFSKIPLFIFYIK